VVPLKTYADEEQKIFRGELFGRFRVGYHSEGEMFGSAFNLFGLYGINHETTKVASKNNWWVKKHQIHRDG
jgi:hypothetical protein